MSDPPATYTTRQPEPYKPPFPYFGGKSKSASVVWRLLGEVDNYVEPFFGSGAVLFNRPTEPGLETVNDIDGMIANFWRAVQSSPGEVAEYADWPVNENDLHARHIWLVNRKADMQARLEGDPDWFDAKAAGWWCWGMCCWIGSGWCSGEGPWQSVEAEDGPRQLVHLGNAGQGVNRKLVHLGDAGQGVNRKRVHLGNAGRGVNRKRVHLGGEYNTKGCGVNREADLIPYFQAISERLRRVRVCCGDWTRICGPAVTWKHGLTGVFLDPPYSHKLRDNSLYNNEMDCADAVRDWAVEQGANPLMRIVMAGYEGEHEFPSGWRCISWKASGGYGGQHKDGKNENGKLERLWVSPYCNAVEQGRLEL